MEVTIPLFPCKSLKETVDFYQTLGFEVTHQQEQPYIYAAVRRGDVEIHFNKLSVWKSTNGVCLVMVTDVGSYHQIFSDALRTHLGIVPTAGFPRITRFRNGHTRFHIFDPSGNVMIFIDQNEAEKADSWSEDATTELATAIQNAAFLRDTYCTDEAASTVLDKALAKYVDATPLDRARALAARAELALALGDANAVENYRSQLRQLTLSDSDREKYADELRAPDNTELWLSQPIS